MFELISSHIFYCDEVFIVLTAPAKLFMQEGREDRSSPKLLYRRLVY
jgi:hypothetical protein